MKKREILFSDEGKVLTNGEHYGEIIYLAEGEFSYMYYEITKEEYEEIQKAEEEKALGEQEQ